MRFSPPLALSLGLSALTLSSASPIIQVRQDVNTTTTHSTNGTNSILKPETVTLLETVASGLGLPGVVIAYTSPKGDGVFTFGNRSAEGDPIDSDVRPTLNPCFSSSLVEAHPADHRS